MNFKLTEEHLLVRDAAREFATNELLPGVIERDNTQSFPIEIIRKMGELGFMGIMVDPKYGGSGMDTISYVLIMEELSKIDASASVIVSVNNSLVCYGLETYGTENQKQKYLTKLATGNYIGAFCLSEPEAGSDATSQQTTAIEWKRNAYKSTIIIPKQQKAEIWTKIKQKWKQIKDTYNINKNNAKETTIN